MPGSIARVESSLPASSQLELSDAVSIALLHSQTPERRGNFKGNFERSCLSNLLANPHGNLLVAGVNGVAKYG